MFWEDIHEGSHVPVTFSLLLMTTPTGSVVVVYLLSHIWLLQHHGLAHQTPLPVGFHRQQCWSGLPFPSAGDLPNSRIEPLSLELAGRFFTTEPPGKPMTLWRYGELHFSTFNTFQPGQPHTSYLWWKWHLWAWVREVEPTGLMAHTLAHCVESLSCSRRSKHFSSSMCIARQHHPFA